MKNELMPYNLQFFAEGENDPDTAAPGIDTAEDGEMSTGTDLPDSADATEEPEADTGEDQTRTVQSAEENAAYAAARRKAEKEIKARDAKYAEKFGNVVNPITGKPIRGEQDYFDALEAQETLERNKKLQDSGVDPSLIEEVIHNSPEIMQARQIIKQTEDAESSRMLDEDIKEIQKIDPEIKSVADIANLDTLVQYCKAHNVRLSEAYRNANFERLLNMAKASTKQSATQAAINQAKGKEHLKSTGGVSQPEGNLVDIPEANVRAWQKAYPGLSAAELKKKYNQSL